MQNEPTKYALTYDVGTSGVSVASIAATDVNGNWSAS
jgi:hypothetical protein